MRTSPCVGDDQAAEDLDERRLARAVRAEQPEDLAFVDAEVDARRARDRTASAERCRADCAPAGTTCARRGRRPLSQHDPPGLHGTGRQAGQPHSVAQDDAAHVPHRRAPLRGRPQSTYSIIVRTHGTTPTTAYAGLRRTTATATPARAMSKPRVRGAAKYRRWSAVRRRLGSRRTANGMSRARSNSSRIQDRSAGNGYIRNTNALSSSVVG